MNNPLLQAIQYLLLALILPPPPTAALPATPKLLCTTTAQSPAASLLKSVMALYTQSCQAPAAVPASRACVTLAQSAERGRGYVVSLCGWGAAFGTCAEAEAAVGALVDGCAEGGGAEGQLAGAWGTVVVGRVVGRTAST